ncbi:MAG: hypothetical protein IM607_08675 [Cytophagales bacterium]|nr:hypothetical protein [Cytophagales bacterium]
MVSISTQNSQKRQNTLLDRAIDTITQFDMNQDALANSVNTLLSAVWKDLNELEQLATEVEWTDPDHPVNVLLDRLQEKVVSAIEAKSADDFLAYAEENGVVFHERAANDFLIPDESQGGIRANEGNGGKYMPAEEEGRTRMVLAALLAMKVLETIKGNIDVTPGGAIREGAVRKRPYNLIKYTAGDVPVQLFVCDEQKQAIYGLRGDDCLSKEAFFDLSKPVTKSFLQEIGGLQIKFNSQWCKKIQKFTEGLIESKPFQQVAPRITNEYLREIVDVYRAMHPGENLTLRSGDIYVRDGQGRYFENGDTFKKVNQSMRDGNRGWPKGSSIKSLSQWLDENGYKNSKRSQADENGYRDNQITGDYLRKIVEVYRERNAGKNPTQGSGDIYVKNKNGEHVKIDDTFNAVNTAMYEGNRGWPKGSSIKSLSQWLDENGYRDNQITDKYLHEIADVYREMHPGKNPTQGSGDIYVKNKNSEYVKTIDTFNAVNKAMREGNRGWPEDSPIKSLPQWLDENGYRDNQITDKYLRKIVDVYRERHSGKNPTQDSGDIYVKNKNGEYVKINDTFNAVNTAMHQGNRGWPKDSPIKSLSQWLEANCYKNSKRSPTQATEGHDAAQLRARGDR